MKVFFDNIYLGDTGCRSILIDFWKGSICIATTGIRYNLQDRDTWTYEKSIENGCLIFSGVVSYCIEPQGVFANDYIEDFYISKIENDTIGLLYTVVFKIGYTSDGNEGDGMMEISIQCRDAWMEDPLLPGVPITK